MKRIDLDSRNVLRPLHAGSRDAGRRPTVPPDFPF